MSQGWFSGYFSGGLCQAEQRRSLTSFDVQHGLLQPAFPKNIEWLHEIKQISPVNWRLLFFIQGWESGHAHELGKSTCSQHD